MADFSSLTHKWRAVPSNPQYVNTDKVTKRNRQPVACQPCRTRKLKCNKGHPCENCVKRNEGDVCAYGKITPAAAANGRKDDSRSSTLRAQERLKHLEDLVRSMVESSQLNRDYSDSPKNNGHDVDSGFTRAAADGGSYVGATHWSAILQHIHELKNDINPHSYDFDEDLNDASKPDLLFGDHRPPSLEHVLSMYLPPRVQVDRRVSQYFNAKYMVIPFLHSKQFQRQYEEFWEDRETANPLWVSTLFSLCSLAAILNSWSAQSPGQHTQTRDDFTTAAGQCLVLGNYSKPQPFVVEALSLFLQCKLFSALDSQKEVALIFSIQTRMAYLMGYHRDGSNFPTQFTPFETEMRRRSWAMIKQFDLMASFQLGIPSNIIPETWDTHLPSNLLDTDFDEDTKILPPSRPENEVTHMLYFLAKTRITDVYARICHYAISFPTTQPSYSEIMVLDAELRKQVDLIPKSLRTRPVAQSITDQPSDIMVRVNLSFLWRKSLCVLHRKHIASAGSEYSYTTCVEAASAICETMSDLYTEFRSGGTFEKQGWMIHNLTIQDFLLGITTLCLTMSIGRSRYCNTGRSPQQWLRLSGTMSVLSILDEARTVCNDLTHRSKEVGRVSIAVSAMLTKLRNHQQSDTKSSDKTSYPAYTTNHHLYDDSPSEGKFSDSNAPDISPLSVSDQPTSITMSSGMCPPDWYGLNKNLGPSSDAASHRRDTPPISTMYTTPDFEQIYASDPDVTQSRSNDIALGPFSHIMMGMELESLDRIDWASFDQFTSLHGDNNSSYLQGQFSIDIGPNLGMGTQGINYTDWESTPPYNLGGRARDPLTGRSQQP